MYVPTHVASVALPRRFFIVLAASLVLHSQSVLGWAPIRKYIDRLRAATKSLELMQHAVTIRGRRLIKDGAVGIARLLFDLGTFP